MRGERRREGRGEGKEGREGRGESREERREEERGESGAKTIPPALYIYRLILAGM